MSSLWVQPLCAWQASASSLLGSRLRPPTFHALHCRGAGSWGVLAGRARGCWEGGDGLGGWLGDGGRWWAGAGHLADLWSDAAWLPSTHAASRVCPLPYQLVLSRESPPVELGDQRGRPEVSAGVRACLCVHTCACSPTARPEADQGVTCPPLGRGPTVFSALRWGRVRVMAQEL